MIHEGTQTKMKEDLKMILVKKIKLLQREAKSVDCHFEKKELLNHSFSKAYVKIFSHTKDRRGQIILAK